MSPTNEIVEENNYYPFGLKHKGYNNWYNLANANALAQQYKYNGKELQTELGLNFYDYGARNYDAALGRWVNIDPLAEKFNNISPYVYSNNSPIFFVDKDGMEPEPPSQVIPDNSVIQLKGVNSSMLTQELIKTAAAMGEQPVTDFKANNTSDLNGHRDGKNGLSTYIQNRLSGTTGVEDFMAEFDDWANDDEVLINVTPELTSVDDSLGTESGSTSENSYNSSSSSSEVSTSFGAKGEGKLTKVTKPYQSRIKAEYKSSISRVIFVNPKQQKRYDTLH
ncbi:predicted protein [Nematostella vectensis]|uniref:RHS repeat-associated core domain-containing protein n=1 Tax=Nematostella vectensis TaxID=45351 RepID=A7T8U4_NEMVE|nr:predicted protein [Nematostella vectensis]|eukprot:XP_001619690.1 hypothetical protein NEMVEDRAFT_v1g223930 [Nematostella vectensis]